jgi:hypothetical protein
MATQQENIYHLINIIGNNNNNRNIFIQNEMVDSSIFLAGVENKNNKK